MVSVVIIFLNTEKFIQEAIESVFAQTYDQWELLLVDDGSTDSSTQIALQYARQYSDKVRYLEHEGHQNRGMSASRNLGIRNAKGEYIALLDADDIWLPHKLEQQVAIMNSQPEVGMVYGPSQKWYSWTGTSETTQRDTVYELGVQLNTLIKPPTLLTLCLEGKASTPCPSNVLLRREVAEQVGGFEESFQGIYQLYEDQAFFSKVNLKVPVYVASACWDKYRKHQDSCVSVVTKAGKADTARLFFLNWLQEYLTQQEVDHTQVRQALKKALWPYRHPILYRLSGQKKQLVNQGIGAVKLVGRRVVPLTLRRWLKGQYNDEFTK
jgi:glycosyltransferase involved in cell wall biosynthesis